jgi:hypothetical protein
VLAVALYFRGLLTFAENVLAVEITFSACPLGTTDAVGISKNDIVFGYDGIAEMRAGKCILIAPINL